MNQYTKGEWNLTGKDDNGDVNVFTDKEYIATVRHEYDAHLIAAAPEMYEALKAIVKWLDDMPSHVGLQIKFSEAGKTCPPIYKKSIQALAKAEGKK